MDQKLSKLVDRLEMSHELAVFMDAEGADGRLKEVISRTLQDWTDRGKAPTIPDFEKVRHYRRQNGRMDERPAIWRYRPKPKGGKRSADDFGSYVEAFSRYHGLNGFQACGASQVAQAMGTSRTLVCNKVNFVEAALRFKHQRDIWYGMLPGNE